MSENLFDDIGFDLAEKILPPPLPDNIIGTPTPTPIPVQTTPSKSGNKIGLIILGEIGSAHV